MSETLKKIILLLITIHFMPAYAMECPKAFNGQTFQHAVVPNSSPQPWQMNVNYMNQGWSIAINPLTQSSPARTIFDDAILKVVYVKTDISPNSYTVACQYSTSPSIDLTVTNNYYFPAPTNPNFKQLADGTYFCQSTASNTAMCQDNTVREVVCGIGKPC